MISVNCFHMVSISILTKLFSSELENGRIRAVVGIVTVLFSAARGCSCVDSSAPTFGNTQMASWLAVGLSVVIKPRDELSTQMGLFAEPVILPNGRCGGDSLDSPAVASFRVSVGRCGKDLSSVVSVFEWKPPELIEISDFCTTFREYNVTLWSDSNITLSFKSSKNFSEFNKKFSVERLRPKTYSWNCSILHSEMVFIPPADALLDNTCPF